MDPIKSLKGAKAYFWKESYAIIRAKSFHPEAFANISDRDEITVIIDQNKLTRDNPGNNDYMELTAIEKDWRLLTMDVVFPLDTVGILASISAVMAGKGISIMAISAYSRDHFLIREKDKTGAVEALREIGITVED